MTDHFEQIEKIARLLARKRMQALTEQEHDELQHWMDTSPEYRKLAEEWMEKDYLIQDFREFEAIDTIGPLLQIKQAIENNQRDTRISKRPKYRSLVISVSIAAAALILGLLYPLGVFDRSNTTSIPLITSYVPILYLDDGSQIALDNSTIVLDNGAIEIHRENSVTEVLYPESGMKKTKSSCMTILIPKGHIYELTLEDGTHVWLNAQTKLKYPVVFDSDAREIELDGEAYLKVAPESSRPFRVLVEGQQVDVLGTEFNIRAYGEEESVYTTLVKGSIEIQTANEKLTLHPGDQAVLSKGGLSVKQVKTANIAGWCNGVFSIEGQSLHQIMVMLARWYDFHVAYEDDKLRDIIFNVVVPRYGELRRILELLERTDEVSFEVKGDRVVVKNI